MKNYLYIIIGFMAMGSFFGCEEDSHIYEGPNYVEFPNRRTTTTFPYNLIETEKISIVSQIIGAHETTDKSIGYAIAPENTTAVEGVHYNLINPEKITIPAQSSFGEIKLEAPVGNFDPGDVFSITFNLLQNGDLPASPNYTTTSHTLRKNNRPILSINKESEDFIKESDTIDTIKAKLDFDAPLETDVAITYEISGTAEEGIDYKLVEPLSNPIIIKKGDTDATIPFVLFDDKLLETDSIIFNIISAVPTTGLSKDSVVIGSKNQVTYFIDDETKLTGFVESNTVMLTTLDIGVNPLFISLSEATENPVTITYSISNGMAGRDYNNLTGGTVVFEPGQTSKKIDFQLLDGAFGKGDFTMSVTLESIDAGDDFEVSLDDESKTLPLKIIN